MKILLCRCIDGCGPWFIYFPCTILEIHPFGQLETVEMETGNGNSQNLMQMNTRVKPLINDHLLKTTSVQRPHDNYVPKMTDDLIPLYKDHIAIRF